MQAASGVAGRANVGLCCASSLFLFRFQVKFKVVDSIQMMHDSEWTLKYDEPEVENVARGHSPSATFSAEGHHISMSHERPCFICFVVWPTISLELYIVF